MKSIEQLGEPETKKTAELEKYQAEPEKEPVNGIGRVLNLVAWRIECDTGRQNIYRNAIEIKSLKGMSYTYMYR